MILFLVFFYLSDCTLSCSYFGSTEIMVEPPQDWALLILLLWIRERMFVYFMSCLYLSEVYVSNTVRNVTVTRPAQR